MMMKKKLKLKPLKTPPVMTLKKLNLKIIEMIRGKNCDKKYNYN